MVLTINGLSEKSLKDAQRRVIRYRNAFVNKNRTFVQELVKAGITVMSENLVPEQGDSEPPEIPTTPHVFMGVHEGIMKATLRLRGKDVMFVEFGAGITYNTPVGTSPNPLGVELGFTIGSYGMGQGAQEYWFYEKDGIKYKSYGTQATMPMYKADMEIRTKFADIAKRVFGNSAGL